MLGGRFECLQFASGSPVPDDSCRLDAICKLFSKTVCNCGITDEEQTFLDLSVRREPIGQAQYSKFISDRSVADQPQPRREKSSLCRRTSPSIAAVPLSWRSQSVELPEDVPQYEPQGLRGGKYWPQRTWRTVPRQQHCRIGSLESRVATRRGNRPLRFEHHHLREWSLRLFAVAGNQRLADLRASFSIVSGEACTFLTDALAGLSSFPYGQQIRFHHPESGERACIAVRVERPMRRMSLVGLRLPRRRVR